MNDTLTSFLRIYRDDDNEWYRLGPGETQNLFDNLLSRSEAAEDVVKQLQKALDEMRDERDEARAECIVWRLLETQRAKAR